MVLYFRLLNAVLVIVALPNEVCEVRPLHYAVTVNTFEPHSLSHCKVLIMQTLYR